MKERAAERAAGRATDVLIAGALDLADATDKRAETAVAAGEPDFAVRALHDDAATIRELCGRLERLEARP